MHLSKVPKSTIKMHSRRVFATRQVASKAAATPDATPEAEAVRSRLRLRAERRELLLPEGTWRVANTRRGHFEVD